MERVSLKEYGRTGVDLSSGIITRPYLRTDALGEDYNEDFTIDKIDHMLDGDGQVTAVWNAITLAIQQAEWDMVPHSDAKIDIEVAEFAEKMIREYWEDLLEHALNYLLYGFMLFEPIYKIEDGMVVWDRLAPRMPHTVTGWTAKDGRVDSVTQYAWANDKDGYREFTIPGSKILRFTYRPRGENFEGKSFLRAAMKHWHHKDLLYKILIIRHERYGIGTPVGALGEGATQAQVDKFIEALRHFRSNEVGYINLPRGSDIDKVIKILVPDGGEAGAKGIMDAIYHHDVEIARSVLAQFLNLGETKTGARAVAEDMSGLFLMGLGAIVKYISKVISRGNRGECGGLRQLVNFNYGELEGYPVWKCERVKKDNSAAIAATIAQLVQSGALLHDESLERHNRRLVGVPWEKHIPGAMAIAEQEAEEDAVPDVAEETDPDPDATTEEVKLAEYARERFEWEEHMMFADIATTLDAGERDYVASWRSMLATQLQDLGETFGPTITRDDIIALIALEMPRVEDLAGAFARILQEMAKAGAIDVHQELSRQSGVVLQEIDELDDDERDAMIAVMALAAARDLAAKTKRSIEDSAITGLRVNKSMRWDDIAARASKLSDSHVLAEAVAVSTAYNLGREWYAQQHAELIQEEIYSAMLDGNTCPVCAAMDGVKKSERPFVTPNPNCYGNIHSSHGNACRCVTVYISRAGAISA